MYKQKGDDSSFKFSSKTEGIHTFGGEGSNVEVMNESEEEKCSEDDLSCKVNSFLDKNELELGFAITDDILDSVLINLSMNKDSLNSYELKEYREFLNKYGSIRDTAFDIYQCEIQEDEELDDKIRKSNIEEKVKKITSTQISFHRSIKKRGRNEKNYWLIAKDRDTQYCINLEKNSNLGHVSYVDSSGNFVNFAKYFSEFLDKIFKKYEKSIQK
ncbi:MAG: SMI1/KNR4 family protein [Candidatus Cardinium sp.]|uniref:SMI1/KNR4 family protein n=1 Tax=Cardinium endosymbiont of Dermatophagoides farinae TaxID=2597823 RepID=UPI001642B8F8|nr:SMI1/KNR4 family protein [Cardinium endosymbiont of Dermatophagoides farinae]UWW97177.1 MAG: SMI1/KNR4 family protein [Candidatus Cardinium sp.]